MTLPLFFIILTGFSSAGPIVRTAMQSSQTRDAISARRDFYVPNAVHVRRVRTALCRTPKASHIQKTECSMPKFNLIYCVLCRDDGGAAGGEARGEFKQRRTIAYNI